MTKEQISRIEKNKDLIEQIVKNRSCSNIPISFREDIIQLSKELNIPYCKSCNTGLFGAIYRIHNLYNIEIEKKKKRNGKRENTQV